MLNFPQHRSQLISLFSHKCILVTHFSLISLWSLATLCSPPCLLVTNTSDVVALDYKTATPSSVVSGLTNAVAIDVHFNLGYIFWSDVREKNIKRFRIDVASTTTVITGIGVCDGLAVDWRASQLYWTDTTYHTISVSDLDGNYQGLLISSGLDQPRAIALDPDNRYNIITDYNSCIIMLFLKKRNSLSSPKRLSWIPSCF